MKKSMIILVMLVLAILTFTNAQRVKKVSGTVTSAEDGSALSGVIITIKGTSTATTTDFEGKYSISVPSEKSTLVFSFIGYKTEEIEVKTKSIIDMALKSDISPLQEIVINDAAIKKERRVFAANKLVASPAVSFMSEREISSHPHNTEEYSGINENIFHEPSKKPLSTFSIDVDKASYSNVRRFINGGQLPPKDAVRIEEMINYFAYDYPESKGDEPFAVFTEVTTCPWNADHQLVQIGLQGKKVSVKNLPASNLVFLIDVSGSMESPDKLPLLKAGFKLLVDQLRPQDKVSIVVYAGAAGLVLEPTSGSEKSKILEALERLQAGGSTAGGQGIKLAYEVANRNFIKEGNNRIILASDGDFNVGASSNGEMERLIEEQRSTGVFLSVLGFGMGNYKDSKMEILADKGNGNYAYIDNLLEAKKVFVTEFGGTLFTIAKDVKIQVEFNPTKVKAYRLIGYENRSLQDEDFNNDKKDAGELGAGHTVTALYEIIPVSVENSPFIQNIDPLKYQKNEVNNKTSASQEMMTVKLRYKKPDGDKSILLEKAIEDKVTKFENTTSNLRFSASVASFGLLLRDSQFKGTSNYESIIKTARASLGEDEEGYRAEFIKLVQTAQLLARE